VRPAFSDFDQLLSQAWGDPAVEAELQRRYLTQAAILVVDFTGMVRRTDAEGIIYALALARRAEREVAAAVQARGGQIVKRVADTAFAVFEEASAALLAALDGHRALHEFNRERTGQLGDGSRNEPIHACIGLGFGSTLVIPDQDLYGAEVNRAFVLGEDVARAGEILCSPDFATACSPLPAGVGAHRAPAAREEEAGFPFLVLRDYREGEQR
jgi:adenylate cyclase